MRRATRNTLTGQHPPVVVLDARATGQFCQIALLCVTIRSSRRPYAPQMTTLAPYELFVAASCLLVGYLALSTWLENTSKHELPGPLKVPLIGNLVVPGRLYEKMAIIGRKHGEPPTFHLQLVCL